MNMINIQNSMNANADADEAPVTAAVAGAIATPAGAGFIVTKEYRRFAEFCDACRRERYIGLCYGSPGVGKTASARQYADWDLVESLLYDYQALARVPGDTTPWRTVLYTPAVANTPRTIDREVA